MFNKNLEYYKKTADDMADCASSAQRRAREWEARYNDEHIRVIALETRIGELKRELETKGE